MDTLFSTNVKTVNPWRIVCVQQQKCDVNITHIKWVKTKKHRYMNIKNEMKHCLEIKKIYFRSIEFIFFFNDY